jgi:hypothetical protein
MAARRNLSRKFVWTFVALLLAYGVCATALTIWKLDGPLSQPLCSERPPFVKPLSQRQAVFVAKVLHIGRTDRDYQSGHEMGHWALARVQHQYWGLPWWSSKIVFLANGAFENGREYFVDGDRSSLVSQMVPLVHIGTCTRSAPLERADIDLGILQDGPPKSGVRIVGRVLRQPVGRPQEVVSGTKVQISGPGERLFVTSDEKGIYDAAGLPPGHYSLSAGSDEVDFQALLSIQNTLKSGDVWGRTLWVK